MQLSNTVFIAGFFVLVACGGSGGSGGCDSESSAQSCPAVVELPKYNVVLFVSDDQRFDTTFAMEGLEEIANQSLQFSHAYVTTPSCAPTRGSILSGGYMAHHSGVLANSGPDGGWNAFTEENTLAVNLQKVGVRTGFIGKYFNGYNRPKVFAPSDIPPGWSSFTAVMPRHYSENWTDLLFIKGTSGTAPADGVKGEAEEYITTFDTQEAVNFLDRYGDEQFFLMVSYDAPHSPAFRPPQDEGYYDNFFYTGRGSQEADISDKPPMAQERAASVQPAPGKTIRKSQKQLESLLEVDRSIVEIVNKVDQLGQADRTIYIFMSDNGVMWSEHFLSGKSVPYEEAIRVPLYVFGDPVRHRQRGYHQGLVAANLDVPATILDLFGVADIGDGESFKPLLTGQSISDRSYLFFENYELGSGGSFGWSGVMEKDLSSHWKYVEWQDGGAELYNLIYDPYELDNLIGDVISSPVHQALAERLNGLRNIMILDRVTPKGIANSPYSHQLSARGGVDANETLVSRWSVEKGELPLGIILNEQSGILSGIPEVAGDYDIVLRVERSEISEFTGLPVSHGAEFTIRIE